MKRAWLLVLVLLLAANAAEASPVAVGASADPRSLPMAGHITYTIYAEWPAGWSVAPPHPPEQIGLFDVSCEPPVVTERAGGGGRLKLRCDLIAYEPGTIELPPLPVLVAGPGGVSELRQAPAISVEVRGPQIEKEPRPLKPQEIVRRDWARLALIAGIVVAALATLAVLIWLLARWWRGRPKKFKDIPGEPADLRALRRLHDPELDRLYREGHADPYYSQLTEIVREYLEGRFGLPAPDRTTSEILDELGEFNLEQHRAYLTDLFRTADLAKFADADVDRGRWLPDRQAAEAFVQTTRPVVAPPTPAVDAVPVAEAVNEEPEAKP